MWDIEEDGGFRGASPEPGACLSLRELLGHYTAPEDVPQGLGHLSLLLFPEHSS